MVPALKSKIWITAQIRIMNANGMFAFVAHKGDEERGGILLKRVPLDGTAVLYERAMDFSGEPVWRIISGAGDCEAETEVDGRISRRLDHDPDLWIIEVEDPTGSLVLDAPLEALN